MEDTPAAKLRQVIAELWSGRSDRWSEERAVAWSPDASAAHVAMAYLGG
jgi:hypothetical protein